jgi:hypothetical protein
MTCKLLPMANHILSRIGDRGSGEGRWPTLLRFWRANQASRTTHWIQKVHGERTTPRDMIAEETPEDRRR